MKSRVFRTFEFGDNKDDNFRISRLISNIIRMRMLAKMLLVYELWFGIVNIVAVIFNDARLYKNWGYLAVYLLLFFINIIFLSIFGKKYTVYSKDMKTVSKYEKIILFYVCIIMLWGSLVSLIDQNRYGHVMVFMVSMICCSVFCFLDTKERLIPFALSSIVLFALLPSYQPLGYVVKSHYINLCVFIPTVFIASNIVYKGYCNNYESNEMLKKSKSALEKETTRNKIINSQLTEANRMLKKLLSIDELTGIANRRGFNNFIEISLENRMTENIMLSVIMIDVDFFKAFNDGYGHTRGDEILVKIAREISNVASNLSDFVARYGGEEFVYASFGTDEKEIFSMAEAIRKKVQDLNIFHEFSTASPFVTISLGGYSMSVKNKPEVEKCISRADKALYTAKENGRNCFYYYRG